MVVQDAVCARYHPSNPRPPGAPTKTDCLSFIPHLQSWYSIPSPFEYLPQKLIARRIRFRFQEDFLAELSEFKTYVSSLVPIFIVCCLVIYNEIYLPTTSFLPPPSQNHHLTYLALPTPNPRCCDHARLRDPGHRLRCHR